MVSNIHESYLFENDRMTIKKIRSIQNYINGPNAWQNWAGFGPYERFLAKMAPNLDIPCINGPYGSLLKKDFFALTNIP